MPKLEVKKSDDVDPLCPHCSEPIQSILLHELGGLLGRRFLYSCPTCHKVLGVTHR